MVGTISFFCTSAGWRFSFPFFYRGRLGATYSDVEKAVAIFMAPSKLGIRIRS